MREVYLDNSATTAVLPEVADIMRDMLTENYGNPSSAHSKGVAAQRQIAEARRILAAACQVKPAEFIFTSGGTEANNLAVIGAARRCRRRGMHLITSRIEHPSVLYAFKALEEQGFQVTYLDADSEGAICPADVPAAVRQDTTLVSLMQVNNEVGSILPVEEIGVMIKKKNPGTLFHVDAVQSFGKLPVEPKLWQADLLTLSAHKIHGPKGIGALYLKESVLLEPLLHGGDQENKIRPGTENTAGIAGFAAATRIAAMNRDRHREHMQRLKNRLHQGVLSQVGEVKINGSLNGAPHILNLHIAGIRGEVLAHALAEKGVYISTGSACHSRRADPSHVLLAMGKSEQEIAASLRFSLSPYNTEEDIDYTVKILAEETEILRRLGRSAWKPSY